MYTFELYFDNQGNYIGSKRDSVEQIPATNASEENQEHQETPKN